MPSTRTISERRSAAARANGAKSRGPVTAQGKTNSSANSLRHGLNARILFDDEEFRSEHAAVLTSYTNELQPKSEPERTLVETMASCQASRSRLWKLETALFGQTASHTLAHAFHNDSHALGLLYRLEARFERQFTRAIADFHASRSLGSPGSRMPPTRGTLFQ